MQLKTIPVGIVGIDSNTVKAYLSIMEQYGLRPRTIIMLKSLPGWKVRLLARFLGRGIADKFISYKRLKIVKAYQQFQPDFQRSFQVYFDFFAAIDYAEKCENYYEVRASNINDLRVTQSIKNSQEDLIIYGGGGIVKSPIFELGIKIIHTHPGYLPCVRGSHGTFWSLLVRNKFGCSTFYMNKGIDMGEIISRNEYELSIFPKISAAAEMIEKLLNFYVDPLIRAKTLIDVLLNNSDYSNLECQKQDSADGESYYFMHDLMRKRIASSLESGEICSKE
jgi:hypothetical protein